MERGASAQPRSCQRSRKNTKHVLPEARAIVALAVFSFNSPGYDIGTK